VATECFGLCGADDVVQKNPVAFARAALRSLAQRVMDASKRGRPLDDESKRGLKTHLCLRCVLTTVKERKAWERVARLPARLMMGRDDEPRHAAYRCRMGRYPAGGRPVLRATGRANPTPYPHTTRVHQRVALRTRRYARAHHRA